MNTAKDQRANEERAKSLRLKDSGVFRRLHEGQLLDRPANSQYCSAAPEQVAQRPVCKPSDLDRALSVLLSNSLRIDGLSRSDAAAACDRQRQHVDEMCKPDGSRRMSAKDLLKICSVSPSLLAVTRDLLDQMARTR